MGLVRHRHPPEMLGVLVLGRHPVVLLGLVLQAVAEIHPISSK
jgi:hypothetical protein